MNVAKPGTPEYTALMERRRQEEAPSRYRADYYQSIVPEPDRVKLADLKPSEKSHMPLDKQQKMFDIMRANPEAGYALFSPSGWSKSTSLYALFREALRRHNDLDFSHGVSRWMHGYQPVVFVQAAELMDQTEKWRYREGKVPIITAGQIDNMRQAQVKFSVFVDEFEKTRKSPFRMEEMYKLIDAMYRARPYGQLVIAGNMTKADLEDVNQYQEGTPRRIEALTSPHYWEFGK